MFFDAATGGKNARIEVREAQGRYQVTIGDKTLDLDWVRTGEHEASVLLDGLPRHHGREDRRGLRRPHSRGPLRRGPEGRGEGVSLGKVAHASP